MNEESDERLVEALAKQAFHEIPYGEASRLVLAECRKICEKAVLKMSNKEKENLKREYFQEDEEIIEPD